MAGNYTEDKLIEKTSMDIFHTELKWNVANVYKGEVFGEDGTIGRDNEAEYLLKYPILKSLQKFNPGLPVKAYQQAYEVILSDDSTKHLAELNQDKYIFLKEGIPVTYKDDKGKIVRNKKLKIFDLDIPTNNSFLAVQQLWLEGKAKRKRRPDIVGFVNGIPLVFIELKAHHRKIKVAYETNLKDYKDVIPKIFHTNAFIILSNGFESKIGSITSKFEHFHEWKRIQEDEEGIISLDTILRGVCEKNRLIDLFENFILFDSSVGKVIKLIAQNHQFIGVNKAITHFKEVRQKEAAGKISVLEAQKLGVFWHTQGSGKSYSMVFLTQKILREIGGGYTFLMVTDRTELDKQIYGTFAGVGAVADKKARATSGENLKELLQTDRRYIFSIIHKFNFDEVITERDNIIVISDEAHRTQGGSLAMNLRKALPNASFMGFTGTPLFKDDELTRRIFGEYVSKYDFKRSIEDGATVPLYYENRGEKLKLNNPLINEQIRAAIEAADVNSDQEDKLKKLFSREYPILTAEKRLRAIAVDIVKHFNTRGHKGKGMFVAIDKPTAVKMYDYISEEWQNYILIREQEIKQIQDEQEVLQATRDLEWTKGTELSVVVSAEQNEIDKFRAWGLDIETHRLKMNTRDLETEFKDEDHPFRFVIVCAMWITGFDVPSLSTLYLDKPLKTHTLMQTIARANRVYEGKNNGLIVDYIETYKALLEALAIYGDSGTKGTGGEVEAPVRPIEELIEDLEESIKATEIFLKEECKFNLLDIINATDNLLRIKNLQEGYNAVSVNDEVKNKFGVLAREVFKKYKALMPEPAVYSFQDRRDAINAIYALLTKNIDEADITHVVKKVQYVVDQSIENLNILLEKSETYGQKVDLSGLDFKKIEEEFYKSDTSRNVAVQSLKERVDKKLTRLLNNNPLRIDYYEKYQEIIDAYNSGKDYQAIKKVFDELVNLFGNLSEEEQRAEKEGLDDDELTVLDLLMKGKKISDKEKAKLKEAAQALLNRLKSKEFRVNHWTNKTQTSSKVRKVINDHLFSELPYPTYEEADISDKTEELYNYFIERYANYGPEAA